MSKFRIRNIIGALVLALSFAGATPAFAHTNMTDWLRMMEKLRQQQPNPQETPWVSARVVKVNAAVQSVTISHGAIRSVGMPAMSMTFGVTDTSRLSTLKKGQRVDIQVENFGGVGKIVNFRAPQQAGGHSH